MYNDDGKTDQKLDSVEREYEIAINSEMYHGDNDRAFELSIGLKQYQEMFKIA